MGDAAALNHERLLPFRAAASPEVHSTLNLYLATLLYLLKKRIAGRATTRGKIGGGLPHAPVTRSAMRAASSSPR